MRKTLFTMVMIFSITQLFAQASRDNSLKIQDLQLSNAPAFNLLDVSPSSIDNVASTKAFSTSVINTLNQGNGIPQNYALEFTPFWYMKHKHYTSYKYFGIDTSLAAKSLPFSQARLWSVSFAFINKDSTTNVGKLQNHNAGIGVRTTLIQIQKKYVRNNIERLSGNWYYSLRDFLTAIAPNIPTREQLDSFSSSKINYGDSIKSFMQEKPFFALNAAAATNMTFDNNSFGSNRINRTGIWIDANLSIDLNKKSAGPINTASTNYFNLSVLGRYINDKDSLDNNGKFINATLIDYGMKAEFQFGKFSIAYEYIKRISNKKNIQDTYKSVGLVHYKVKDGVFITGGFGQNFSTHNNLITTIGINWGISNGQEKIDSDQ